MKIGIVGSGFVGATAAYAMVMRGVGREIVLVDVNKARAEAEADDILHAVPFAHALEVRAGEYADLAGCRVVVITAGVNQRPGETRMELLSRNAQIFNSVIPAVLQAAPETILVISTNPVDVMTHLAARIAAQYGVPRERVLGSGTSLDTARFRALLGRAVGVDSQHVHAYVLGEHGDSEVLSWSLVSVAGFTLDQFCEWRKLDICAADRSEIERQVRHAAYEIIEGKGATYYGIGSALARIVEAILRDQLAVLTVSSHQAELLGVGDVTLSLPTLVGGSGVLATLQPPLAQAETDALRRSAQVIRAAIADLPPGA